MMPIGAPVTYPAGETAGAAIHTDYHIADYLIIDWLLGLP
jgi:hypothetical protein